MNESIPYTCTVCYQQFLVKRDDVHYWPDHLWPGAIQAHARCHCGNWDFKWAHSLPKAWHEDTKRFHWAENLQRLLCSCEMHAIKAAWGPPRAMTEEELRETRCLPLHERAPTPEDKRSAARSVVTWVGAVILGFCLVLALLNLFALIFKPVFDALEK